MGKLGNQKQKTETKKAPKMSLMEKRKAKEAKKADKR
jgi:hypothetical protein